MKNKMILLTLIFMIFACKKEDTIITISVPKTISSIPILELNGLKIKNQTINVVEYSDHVVTMAFFGKFSCIRK